MKQCVLVMMKDMRENITARVEHEQELEDRLLAVESELGLESEQRREWQQKTTECQQLLKFVTEQLQSKDGEVRNLGKICYIDLLYFCCSKQIGMRKLTICWR